jgi:hypothetical protein
MGFRLVPFDTALRVRSASDHLKERARSSRLRRAFRRLRGQNLGQSRISTALVLHSPAGMWAAP